MFVHYTDNSIMALKKGVAIDLNAIDSNLLKYYNHKGGFGMSTRHPYFEPHLDDPKEVVDYNKSVNAYKKTFPSKQDVIDQTPDPSVRSIR